MILLSDEQDEMGNTRRGFVPKCGSIRTDQQKGWNRKLKQNGDEIRFLATHRRFFFIEFVTNLQRSSDSQIHTVIARFRSESQNRFKAR